MRRVVWVLILLSSSFLGRPAQGQARCGAGKDLVVQALERVQADSGPAQLGDADQLLKRAIELCSDFGEAWYYRSLVESKLGHAQLASYAMRQAQLFPSDALSERIDPLALSTPRSRGLEATPTPGRPSQPAGGPAQKWALVIGIASFEDKLIPPLSYTAAMQRASPMSCSARSMVTSSRKMCTSSLMIRRRRATSRSSSIGWLAAQLRMILSSSVSPREVDTAGVSYIITHDTDIGTDPNSPDVNSLYATALPMVDLANAVAARVRAERTAIFLDTCFSGNAAQPEKKLIVPGIASGSVAPATLDYIKQESGRVIFTASGVNEESLESNAIKHGYFTYYLVQALQPQNGAIPLTQAFAYVQQHVHSRAQTEAHVEQNPVLSRSEGNTDFSLGAPSGPQTNVQHSPTQANAE